MRLTVIYIDVLLFINTILTFAVLITAEKLMKRQARTGRLVAAAAAGSLLSLILFFGVDGSLLALPVKAASSLLIARIAFPYISRREYLRTALMTVAVSVVYSGAFILFYRIFRPSNMAIINDVVYFELNPLILLGLTAVIYLLISLFRIVFRDRIKSTVVRLSFRVGGTTYRCIGKVDTGCSLTEPFSGAPVIIVDPDAAAIPDDAAKRIVPYTTVDGSSLLYAVKADGVTVDSTPVDKEIYIAVKKLGDPNIQAIINADILR